MNAIYTSKILITMACLIPLAPISFANSGAPAATSEKITLNQNDLKFKPAPGLPAGIMIAKLRGDLSKPQPYTIRFKLPKGVDSVI